MFFNILFFKIKEDVHKIIDLVFPCCLKYIGYFAVAGLQMTPKQKPLMAKPIYNLLWTPRSSAEHSRTEVTWSFWSRETVCRWNISIPTYTTLEEWEREETLCRLIQPWNIALLLNAFQLLQMMCCVSSGQVRKTVVAISVTDSHKSLPHFFEHLFTFLSKPLSLALSLLQNFLRACPVQTLICSPSRPSA